MSNTYPRESIEYVRFADVTVDGSPAAVFEYAVTAVGGRPVAWTVPASVDGKQAFLLDGTRAPGTYKVWVRVSDNPEVPVIEAGTFRIS